MKPLVCIYAHPRPSKSLINKQLKKIVDGHERIHFRDLYELYPNFIINVAREQELLKEAKVILWHHPMYWYSCPSLLKEWIDQVFTPGFAFGAGGKSLEGKYLLQVISCGAAQSTYKSDGTNHFSMEELLAPFTQTARYCGLQVLTPLIFYGVTNADKNEIKSFQTQYENMITQLLQENYPELLP